MPRGGARIGSGRKKKGTEAARDADRVALASLPGHGGVEAPSRTVADPIAFLLGVLGDPKAEDSRKDRIAIALAPYFATKASEGGKKQERERAAKTAGLGKFAPAAPPRLVSVAK